MIIGEAELVNHLDKLANIDITSGVKKAISFVQESAKMNAPVGISGELRESIFTRTEKRGEQVTGICGTVNDHAAYVEFGTGPRGQAEHSGISPDVAVAYSQSPWWVHESQLTPGTAEMYHWSYIDTEQGRFYQVNGQPAQPYLYPALHDNQEAISQIVSDEVRKELRR